MKRATFYDTSIYSNFCEVRREKLFSNFVKCVERIKLFDISNQDFVNTPILFLEILGLNIKDEILNSSKLITPINNLIKESNFNNYREPVERIFNLIRRELNQVECIQLSKLEKRFEDKRKYYNKWYESCLEIFLRDLKIEDIVNNLATEILQDINYESFVETEKLNLLNSSIYRCLYERMRKPNTNAKILRRALVSLKGDHRLPSIKLKPGQDFVDMEFIHASLVGSKFNGRVYEVVTFTCESKETTKRRLAMYHGALTAIHSIYCENILQSNKSFKFVPGHIFHVSATTGEIVGKTTVGKFLKELETFHKQRLLKI